MSTTKLLLSTLPILLLITSCSDSTLSRGNALKLFEAQPNVQSEMKKHTALFISVNVGRISRILVGQFCDDKAFLPYGVQAVQENKLVEAGIVEMKELTPCGDWQITLTPNALKDIFPWDKVPSSGSTTVGIKVSTLKDVQVSGIVQDGPHASADFDLLQKLTPSGMAIAKVGGKSNPDLEPTSDPNVGIVKGTLTFTRYDDGWRMDDMKKDKH